LKFELSVVNWYRGQQQFAVVRLLKGNCKRLRFRGTPKQTVYTILYTYDAETFIITIAAWK